MKNIYTITEQEKNRILGMHQNATKKQYLMEQAVGPGAVNYGSGTTQKYSTTGSNRNSTESNDVFNRLNWYCTEDRNNTLANNKPIDDRSIAYIKDLANNFLYNVKFNSGYSGPNKEYAGYLKSALLNLKTGSELCYFHNYLRSEKNIPSGIHGALSKNYHLPFDWKMALDAMTPAFTDADNILRGTQTPEQTGTDDDESTPDNEPVENIAPSLINLIRTKVGSKQGAGLTLNNDDLTAILAKVAEIPDK